MSKFVLYPPKSFLIILRAMH